MDAACTSQSRLTSNCQSGRQLDYTRCSAYQKVELGFQANQRPIPGCFDSALQSRHRLALAGSYQRTQPC